MTLYHINEEGNPGSCKAKPGRCPFGSPDDHHPTKELARQAYEERMEAFAQRTFTWPKHRENRSFKTERGTVLFQMTGQDLEQQTCGEIGAWLTTDEGETVGYIKLFLRNEEYHPSIGQHLAMCDIEVRESARGKGYGVELRKAIEKETGLLIYSGGSYTPEGWEAFGHHARLYPGNELYKEEGATFRSMGFVASWANKLARFPIRGLKSTEEQQSYDYEEMNQILRAMDDKELTWVDK